ncbi:transcriptional regulator, TetR family [Streptomyces zhaozhouensis]|uniref:Transcriptional regulator, TetR family n=1 Tax=Streptomyces zhaozhouensis TaxID=1300267 RepID=A0A286DKH8_9ACTN|nr:TetR family transcriptional regulator [Streptomyces zhaozhouensis]SOD59247.1 transcriptional regulator, TetR family [Streptomyces zhaozhouensis]
MSRTTVTGSREAQKLRTRQAMLDAALDLLEEQSLSSLGLREVTRAVGVTPTAFYRHFRDIEDLGVALVHQALGNLHTLVRATLVEHDDVGDRIDHTVALIERHVRAHPAHLRFLVRERHGGVRAVRLAIAEQLDRFVRELAAVLALEEMSEGWSESELEMLAGLLVDQMVLAVSAFLSAMLDEGPSAPEVAAATGLRLRLIHLGRAASGRRAP